MILNQEYNRPPRDGYIPAVEHFNIKEDPKEQKNLSSTDYKYYFLLQDLFLYKNTPSHLGTKANTIELSPELDQKLKELGYVK